MHSRVLALELSQAGDERINGRYLQANYLSSCAPAQYWSSNAKSSIKIKKGLTSVPGFKNAWAIIDIDKMRPADSIILFACEAKEDDIAPPAHGWETIGGAEPAPMIDISEATTHERIIISKRTKTRLAEQISQLCTRTFIFTQTAEIHGAVKGLYDYGPTGCSMKSNMLQQWKNHFVIEDDMLEVECTVLTPFPVLKASGHVDKFSDFVVRDVENGAPFRADKLLEGHIETMIEKDAEMSEADRQRHMLVHGSADAYSREEMGEVLNQYNVRAPGTGNALTPPEDFNLMFSTQIGPSGKVPGFLRPETAQGIFVNFKKLLEYNNGKVPFAAAQIGLAFRNEIAPRNGLVRVREFQQAEIEHFCGPDGGVTHPKFDEVVNVVLNLVTKAGQATGEAVMVKKTVGQAVAEGDISTQTLGYYMARSQLYYQSIGINLDNLRFRQHKDDEMAHYANDCWDAETNTTSGWLEITGHADRACFDLTCHANATGQDMRAQVHLDTPEEVRHVHKKPNKRVIGQKFRRESKNVLEYINELDNEGAEDLYNRLQEADVTISTCKGEYTLTKEMLDIVVKTKLEHTKDFYPWVVEPSYGVGRIMVSLLEHAYWERADDENRAVLSLPPLIAPYKVFVLPLSKNPDFRRAANDVHRMLKRANISTKMDDSRASIGKKYARSDECGTPFACTIYDKTLESGIVTIRERDSTTQIECRIDELVDLFRPLVNEERTWDSVLEQYGALQRD